MADQPRAPDDHTPAADPLVPPRVARGLYAAVALTCAVLLVIDVGAPFGWEVSSNALGLVAILLAIPLADQLRKLRVGAVEAEFAERFGQELDNVQRFVLDRTAEPDAEPDEPGDSDDPSAALRETRPLGHVVRRVVWVDDRPESNTLEAAELRRRFDVVQVTSTDEGIAEVAKDPSSTAVITDAVRGADLNAGGALIEALARRFPQVPVYVYCGPGSVAQQADDLIARGARMVTASWSELAQRLRRDAAVGFEAAVGDTLRQVADEVERQRHGVDFVATMGEVRIAVEAKDWRRTPKAEFFDRALTQVAGAIESGDAMAGVIVSPVPAAGRAQLERLPQNVEATDLAGLPDALSRLAGR